jgi:hypothetical protein
MDFLIHKIVLFFITVFRTDNIVIIIGAVAKSGSFGFAKCLIAGGAKPNVPLAGGLKEILKNAKGWLFRSFLSLVPIAKHGRFVCLPACSIWSVCRVHFQSLSCCVVCLFSIGGNGLRVGDVALCCACGKAISLTRC